MDYDYRQQEGQFRDANVVSFNGPEDEEQDYYEGIQQQEVLREVDGEELRSGGNEETQARDSSSAGKIFVGGVSWETTEETFANYFGKYGEIMDSVIMTDRHSGRPRGFGFVTFVDPAMAERVLGEEHIIDGRPVEVKRTVPRDMGSKGVTRTKKIFVGGIPASLTEDELKEYFSFYGSIIEHQIMLDHKTGRSRGFGFVTFESEDAVDQIFSDGKTHKLGGKLVEIKMAEPKRPGGDYGSAAKSSGFADSTGGYGAAQSSSHYGGKMGRGYGGYGDSYLGYGAYSNYGGGYAGSATGFYGGYGGYGGFGGPMMYGGGDLYGGNIYGAGYGSFGGPSGGKGYGSTGDGGGGFGSGRGYGNSGGFSSGKGYGGSGNGSGAANGRHHPYRK